MNRKKDEDDDDVVMLLRMDEEEVQSIVPIFTPPIVPLLEVKVVNHVNQVLIGWGPTETTAAEKLHFYAFFMHFS